MLAFDFLSFSNPARTEIYTLSLHDALPISVWREGSRGRAAERPSGRSNPSGRSDHRDRKSTRLNSSHVAISYAVFCLKIKSISGRYSALHRRSRLDHEAAVILRVAQGRPSL